MKINFNSLVMSEYQFPMGDNDPNLDENHQWRVNSKLDEITLSLFEASE
jgi:hypothetical protein